MVVLIVLIRKDVARLRRVLRFGIMIPAAVAAAMLGGLVLSPKLIRTWPDPRKPVCTILVDGSRSMLLTDRLDNTTAEWLSKHAVADEVLGGQRVSREEVVRPLLTDSPAGWLSALKEQFDVRGWRFGSEMSGLSLEGESSSFSVDEDGYFTDLGEALKSVARASGGTMARAVILISDGAWNFGADPTEVALTLGQMGTPVYAVGLGDLDPPRDVAVLALHGPKEAFLGDEIVLVAEVSGTGIGTARIPVKLTCSGETVGDRSVVAQPSGRPVRVSFTYVPERPGPLLFTARVNEQSDETNSENNSVAKSVTVSERKIKVLLIDSEPRWEFRFIRSVLERDPAVEPEVCLLRPGVGPTVGEGYIEELPTEKEDFAEYDVVVLGDVPMALLPDKFAEELAGMVKQRGGGLIVIAGRQGNYLQLTTTALGPMLPVVLDGTSAGNGSGRARYRIELTQEGASHLMTRLAVDPEENEVVWAGLEGSHWSASVGGLAKGATALLVHPHRLAGISKLPLLSVHRVGRGKAMFCGMDETWRWRRGLGDKHHYRFWAQSVRWMARKQLAEGDSRVRLWIDRVECDVGETVEVEAYCFRPDGFPLEDGNVSLSVAGDDGRLQRLAMEKIPGGWGTYRKSFMPMKPGKHEIRPVVSVYGEEPLSSSVSLEVQRVDLESRFLCQDIKTLKAIAEASGGKYFEVTKCESIPPLLAAKVERSIMTGEYSPCRHWAYYSVLVLMLATVWLLKKRSGLA